MSIHEKTMFHNRPRLHVEWDYTTNHNIKRHDNNPTLVEKQTPTHTHPVFHTNRSTWWSSNTQEWATTPKVMWTRSGTTKPFYDPGTLGGTDMVYFVRVNNETEGTTLAANLNLPLMHYIYKTAKWSGFGNERIFTRLPNLPRNQTLTEHELNNLFHLTQEEIAHVSNTLTPRRRKTQRT
jgi:hypothetical protein